jgi:hypothetical protein
LRQQIKFNAAIQSRVYKPFAGQQHANSRRMIAAFKLIARAEASGNPNAAKIFAVSLRQYKLQAFIPDKSLD